MKIKVLPLSFPFNYRKEIWEDCVKEENRITPVFNRNGYYLDRISGKTWLEIDGEAWLYKTREGFEYSLKISEGNNRIHPDCMKAIKVLISHKIAPKSLREKYRIECDRISIGQVYKESSLAALQMRKRCKSKFNR
jgi:hypothetical protein